MAKISKGMFVDALAVKTDLSKRDVENVLDAMVEEVTAQMQAGNEIVLTGFGTFGVTHRKARTGRNPSTGESIQIPATDSPKFKAGKALKDALK